MTRRAPLSLDGSWHFWPDPTCSLSPDMLRDDEALLIQVPAPWQAHSDELRDYTGDAWYQRTFELGADWLDDHLFLCFGAVDYRAEVWLNGEYVGAHEGGYLPFEWNVTAPAKPGRNRVTVRVSDPAALFAEIPHGKQSWYGPLSGIWQSVSLQRRAARHVQHLRVVPQLETGRVTCYVRLSQEAETEDTLIATITDPDGAVVAVEERAVGGENRLLEMSLEVAEVRAWSPDSPMLYQLQLSVRRDDEVIDPVAESFGFRTIETRDGYLYLNGEMIYLRGALDQDYYPGTISTPPSLEFLEDQLRKAKDLGLNCLRCHIKVPDPRYYEVADRLGMLIWTELPNWHTLTTEASDRAWRTMERIVERDGNHPSIIIWTIVNEDWGTDLKYDPAHRAWLREAYERLKVLDPTRLVVDNSPCEGNFHVVSDIEDYHFYRAIPDHAVEWDLFVNDFAARLAPTYSPFGDAIRRGDEPLILSEFGNWGLPDVDQLRDENGQEPWWFGTGLEWGQGVVYPHDVQHRFKRWALDRVFGGWKEFVAATQWQEFYALKYEIEAMRRRPQIAGYVITEFTDVHWEANGLLDMERNPKAFHDCFARINADTVIYPLGHRAAYWSGERAELGIGVSHGASPGLGGGTLSWSLDEEASQGQFELSTVAPASTASLGPLVLDMPDVDQPTTQTLRLTLDASADVANEATFSVFPKRRRAREAGTRLWVADPGLAARLQAQGYLVVSTPAQADLVMTSHLGYEHVRYIREGGPLLLLANTVKSLPNRFLGLQVKARKNSVWEGDWASSFTWLRRDGPFAFFPGGPLLDASYMAVAPDHVITGLGPWDFEANVFAGLFVGWIHKVAGVISRHRYGAGRAVITTFRLSPSALGVDPVATHLLDALMLLAVEGNGA